MKTKIKTNEPRQQKKEAFRNQVIAEAHKIVAESGLEALSMRAIAKKIACSQSKIYEVFKDKNHLCETLCCELCEVLLKKLSLIEMNTTPKEGYLKMLFLQALLFHEEHPHSDHLFTLVCYGPQFSLPTPFREIERLFVNALYMLQSPILNKAEKIVSALNAIRFLFIGASQLSVFGTAKAQEIAISALDDLIRGWKN